jgi:hypothetical protein
MHATCAIGIEILQQILASDSLAIPSLIVIKKIDFGVAINVRIKRDGGGHVQQFVPDSQSPLTDLVDSNYLQLEPRHKIKTHRRWTPVTAATPSSNCHRNADAMVLASVRLRCIPPPSASAILNIIEGVNASQTRTG